MYDTRSLQILQVKKLKFLSFFQKIVFPLPLTAFPWIAWLFPAVSPCSSACLLLKLDKIVTISRLNAYVKNIIIHFSIFEKKRNFYFAMHILPKEQSVRNQ